MRKDEIYENDGDDTDICHSLTINETSDTVVDSSRAFSLVLATTVKGRGYYFILPMRKEMK